MNSPENAPALTAVLRHYGPWLVGIAVVGVALAAHLDLRARVTALESARPGGSAPGATEHAAEPAAESAAAMARAAAAASAVPGAPPVRFVPPVSPAPPVPAGAEPASAPVVTQGPPPAWSCQGTLAQDAVRRTIGQSGGAVLRCYEERRQQVPTLRGTLLVRLRVAASGAVDRAYLAGVDDPQLVSCVGNLVVGWRFPSPSGGDCAVVEAPFAFVPP